MLKRSLPGAILFLVSIAVLLLTLVKPINNPVLIPFSTSSGETGNITIEIPSKVWAGDQFTISSRIEFDTLSESISPTLIGRLETSIEESIPRGEVILGLDSKTPVVLEWTLRTYQKTVYPGTLWLWVDTGGQENLLLAREFTVFTQDLLGVKIVNVRIAAGLVALAALMVTLYLFFRKRD